MKKPRTHNEDPNSKSQRPQNGENPPSTPAIQELKESDTGRKDEDLNSETQRLQGADTNAPPASLSGNQRLFSPQQKGMIVEPVPRLQSALLALFIAVIALDACPAFFRTLDRAKSAIDPLVDVTGLWQGSWQLFAPDVDKVNSRVSAEILFSDGTTVRWNSPDWTKLAPLDRFMRFREAEFYDNIRRDSNSGAWPSFADYLARRAVPPGRYDSRPAHVALYRHWVVIPRPKADTLIPYGTFPEFTAKYLFYQKSYN